MKKFSLVIGSVVREVNANEYSVSPKLGAFSVMVLGLPSTAWTTSGKGKSAINNHYIYFRDPSGALYYVKSSGMEVEAAKKEMRVEASGYVLPVEAEEQEDLSQTTHEEVEDDAATVTDEPAPKRSRSRK